MATFQTATITSACTSCGGKLNYHFKTNSNKCEYCGNESPLTFQSADGGEQKIPASYIPFTYSVEEFKDKSLTWLAEGDYTPIDLISPNVPLGFYREYIPVYFYGGEYTGKYTILDSNNNVLDENRPLTDTYELFCYGGEFEDIQGALVDGYIPKVNLNETIPFTDRPDSKAAWLKAIGHEAAWNTIGSQKATKLAQQRLSAQDGSKIYRPYVRYNNSQVNTLYLPFYHLHYKYNGQSYAAFVNGVTGELVGMKPVSEAIKPPTRRRLLIKALLRGLGLWVLIVFAMSYIPMFTTSPGHKVDPNKVLPEPYSSISIIAFVILMVVLPIVLPTVAFPYIQKNYFEKLRKVRAQMASLVLSGAKPSPFV